MSHTNSTTNYALPQFLTSDKPAWLTDINNAFSDIDTAVYNAQTKADTAYTDAGNAQLDATSALTNAAAADAKGAGALASIEVAFDATTVYAVGAKVIYNSLLYRCVVAVTTPGPWTGSDNWERITVDTLISSTDSKIGTLTSLSTTDKTSMVAAVNEVNGKVDDIESSLYFTATIGGVTVPFWLRKIGSVATFIMQTTSTVQFPTSWTTLVTVPPTLPAPFKPVADQYNTITLLNGTLVTFWIDTNGLVRFFASSGTASQASGSFTYMLL